MKKIKRWDKSCRIWKLEKNVMVKTPVRGFDFDDIPYLSLKENGDLEIRGGYAWNGCSPKTAGLGTVFGTPEGALPQSREKEEIESNLEKKGYTDLHWNHPRTYYATLVHDSLYQISDYRAKQIDRKDADLIFFDILRAYRFPAARLYYLVVRIFGRYYWGEDPL